MNELKIIFVEDTEDDVELMKRELAKGGISVRPCVITTQEEFERAIARGADAVICDYSLPQFDAVTALKVFNRFRLDIPFIIVSGSIQEELAVECMRNGAADYLLKDRMTRLPEALRQALEKSSLREKERQARKKAEQLYEEVQAASRLKDEFLATLSHELRTHLAVIMGWADLLRKNAGGIDQKATVDIIYRNSLEQLRIVDDVLDMSQIIFSKLQLNLQPTDVARIIHFVAESLAPEAQKRRVKFDVDIGESVESVVCDAGRFEQIMRNLLTNAVKFNKFGGVVRVGAAVKDDRFIVAVADEGEGIEEKFIPYVFDRFRQEDTSNTRKHGGLGLGLAIVHSLVSLHDGRISARSGGKGKGAEFVVSLPVKGPDKARQGALSLSKSQYRPNC